MNSSPTKPQRRGLLFAVSSPSGAGKTSLCRLLLEQETELMLSVSVTTRPRRSGEVDGRDYHFRSQEQFAAMREAGELVEHAEVFGNCYGTPRAPVEEALAAGRDILFDIDWQGVRQLAEWSREDLVCLFLLPPSAEELSARLRKRAADSEEVIRRRMEMASGEISHYAEYDYVLVNEDLQESLTAAREILAAERRRRIRRVGLAERVRRLREELRS